MGRRPVYFTRIRVDRQPVYHPPSERSRTLAYLTIARMGGDPDRLLDEYRRTSGLMDQVGHDHGLILHAGARTRDGLLIVNLWPSSDGSQSAAADPRRLDALRQVAVSPATFNAAANTYIVQAGGSVLLTWQSAPSRCCRCCPRPWKT